MKSKIFKTINEQIDILESRGLIVEDYDRAKEILLRENYFFLNGYRHLFMQNARDDKYIDGTTFDELYGVFTFDRRIRNIFFKNILVIENNIKSIMSYQLSKKYGFKDRDYLNPKNFNQDPLKSRQVKDVLNKMKRQIRVNGTKHSATLHYINNYDYIPLWILVKVLSLGIVSEFYSILTVEDQTEIAAYFGVSVDTMKIYLGILANYRNLCAHEDMLYSNRTQKSIPDNEIHEILKINKIDDEYIYGKNDLFSVIIMLKELLTKSDFNDFFNEFNYEMKILESKILTLSKETLLMKLGFPNNFEDIKEI